MTVPPDVSFDASDFAVTLRMMSLIAIAAPSVMFAPAVEPVTTEIATAPASAVIELRSSALIDSSWPVPLVIAERAASAVMSPEISLYAMTPAPANFAPLGPLVVFE